MILQRVKNDMLATVIEATVLLDRGRVEHLESDFLLEHLELFLMGTPLFYRLGHIECVKDDSGHLRYHLSY